MYSTVLAAPLEFSSVPRKVALRTLGAIGMTFILAACGGGQGDSSAGNNASAVTVSGSISGFGSVIVNGVRFDDSRATVIMDDDTNNAGRDDLRLGMRVEVEGEQNSDGATGNAVSISSSSYALGPVGSINISANELNILGLSVTVTPSTVFDGVTGLGDLVVNDYIEVHGIPDNAGTLRATRLELKDESNEVRLIGTARNVNAEADTFILHGNSVSYQSARLDEISGDVSEGMLVRIRGILQATGDIAASRVRQFSHIPRVRNGSAVEIEGIVTRFDSPDSFEVNGLEVEVATDARREGTPALGIRLEVEGKVDNGVLIAKKFKVKSEDADRADGTEVKSTISSIDFPARTFKMREGTVTVSWDSNTSFDPETMSRGAEDLSVNKIVEVKGRIVGNTLVASKVKLED